MKGTCSSAIGRVLLAVVLVSGITAVLMAIYWWPNLSKQMASDAYLETTGEIVEHRLKRVSHARKGGPYVYTNHFITFQYTVGGRTYFSDKKRYSDPYFLPYFNHQFQIQNYPVGKTVPIFYDSETPTEAILLPGLSDRDRLYLGIFRATILITLVYWPVAIYRRFRKARWRRRTGD